MKPLSLFLLAFAALFLLSPSTIMAQPKNCTLKNRMMYADSTRRGKPYSKNPCVIRFEGRYLMYSSVLPVPGSNAREIEVTESHDLTNWRNVGYMRISESYERNGISAPCAMVIKGKVHIFYQTYGNGKEDAICHAVSENGISDFRRNPTNPVFRPDGDWNCGRAIDAEVFLHNGKYFLYYATRDPEFKIQMQGVAVTPENTSFSREEWTHLSKERPILKPELPWEGECIEAASLIKRNGMLYMFYAGGYNNAPQQIGVATSHDGVTWKRLFSEPFLANGRPEEWNSSESGHPAIFDQGKRTFLFFQGNNDNGNTWWISNVEVGWNRSGPYVKTSAQPLSPERGFISSQPATHWEQALVSGNGKYGALVYGQPLSETIILNHARLYMPVHEPLPPPNTGVHLAEIRRMIADGLYQQAADFVVDLSKNEGYGGKRWTDPFIPAFNIRINMAHNGDVRNYSRSVDFQTGVVSVQWCDTLGPFQRRLFVSRADDAVVLQIKGEKKESVTCTLTLEQQSPENAGGWNPGKMLNDGIKEFGAFAEKNNLYCKSYFTRHWEGSLKGYEGISHVVVKGGKTVVRGDSIHISGASEVLVLTKIEMIYRDEESQINELKKSFDAVKPDFDLLLARHTKNHGDIFNRSRLVLEGSSDRNLTSEELIAKSAYGSLNPALLEKEYDAARYNILSSSGEMFPNLQGIWSGTYGPPWSGDFTLNGNVQCALSANLSANMAENMEPFFRFMETHMDEFRLNAKRLYNCRGIHVPSRASTHGLNNHFDGTWPMTFWTSGAGWAAQFFYDYYLYTGDTEFLLKRALPFMMEAALFYEDFLKAGMDGKLLFSPGYSPENHPANSTSQACYNATMEIGVARELLNNCIAACSSLGINKDDIDRWKMMLSKMPPYLINEKGAVKEWSVPLLEDNDAHRHASHLYALFNGIPDDIAGNPELVKAFGVALQNRLELRRREFGGESMYGRPPGEMAFGIVQQGFAAASLRNADDCGLILDYLANSYWFPNMVTTHNPKSIFNLDISGGLPALIVRMLVDSQPGWLEFLPAWPKNLPDGKIEGVKLRGQIELKELIWKNRQITAVLKSEISQKTELRSHQVIETLTSDVKDGIISDKSKYYLILPEKQYVKINLTLR